MKDSNTKEQFIDLRAQGLSYQKIAATLGISKQTALNWAKELHIEIHNRKALEMDALYEKHFMTTKAQLEIFGEQLTKIRRELQKRSLENVSTEKLFSIFFKTIAAARAPSLEVKTLRNLALEDLFEEVTTRELA